ncbi:MULTISPECIES: FAD-dependent oxidoreductase [unclassified Pseudonocardia]|uniref:FAD-dependent oxidoreductase n=1 Tax=unclassified Pseudonocardia TaxID=2619320 RepID=UPI0001FFEE1B|nr:FAD-dependent oxidoreductase [Pseudonocardia sp. Ae707_Ps1]OLM19509.1 Ferredoxin--NADP(+) reductase, actinobacterial (eukaryote-like) type [Pseudonocardia sp. Ae707_Ps1]
MTSPQVPVPRPYRVAVIGSGPSGLYTAEALLEGDPDVQVDVFDRLPAPYGLVRYGVAPDHLKMKSVIRALVSTFDDADRVRFLGNVHVGDAAGGGAVPPEVLREHYHAVVHATGSAIDRDLGIPGERLAGSVGSGAFVSWYCGHPDAAGPGPALDRAGAVVVGAGNVAIDVARILARPADDLAATDLHDAVLDRLRDSAVTDVHVLVRRGPQHVRFTPAELRALGKLDDVEIRVHDDGILAAGVEEPAERRMRQVLETLTEWAADPPGAGGRRRIHLRFLRSPVRLVGDVGDGDGSGRVRAIEIERNEIAPDGSVRGTGETSLLETGLVVRAIGYAGEPVPGLPFDGAGGTVPHEAGRVVLGGEPLRGSYVTGWIKRGPTGVIGTNKGDGAETAASLLADLPGLATPPRPGGDAVLDRLREFGVDPVLWEDWQRLDAAEIALGQRRGGTDRVKIAERTAMLDAARGTRTGGR